MTRKLLLLAASSLALLSSVPLAAYAQTAAKPAEADTASTLGEVVVVARRTQENLQSVPLSVTAVSPEQLQQHTITTGTDLQKLVPTLNVGVSIFGSGQQYSLRGVRTGVVTYFNEVPTSNGPTSSNVIDLQLWDLSSVQALSGPQGTLFGRNSTGGAVLFLPQRPSDRYEGYLEGRVGSYNLREVTGVLNLPVNDKLKVRLGLRRTERDGIVDNVSGPELATQDRTVARASVVYEPTDWLSNYSVLTYSRRNETPNSQISGAGGTLGPCSATNPLPCVYGARYALELRAQAARGIRSVSIPLNSVQLDEPWMFTNVLAADFNGLTLKYIAGYAGGQSRQFASQLSIPLPVIIGENLNHSRQTTHELQLVGKSFDDRLSWIGGLFYSDATTDSHASYLLFAQPNTPFSPFTTQQTGGHSESKSKAAYAQATLSVTDQLKLTGGLRYTEDSPSTDSLGYSAGLKCNLPNFPNVNLVTCRQHIETKADALTYNLSADFQVTPQLLVYATTRKGYNVGGFNANINDPSLQIVRPEFITDYEGGLKADWHIGSIPVRTNASAFLAKYKDIQRTTSLIFQGLVVTGNFNAASATIYGAQFEFLARPIEGLDIQGSYGYLHTKYDSFLNPLLGDLSGNKFAQAPEKTFNLSATYTHALPTGKLVANASYSYISEVTFADDNLTTPGNTAKGYGLVDLRLDWKDIGDKGVNVGVYVKNAADEEYILNATDRTTPFGFVSRFYGDPRTYGLELRYAFGGAR